NYNLTSLEGANKGIKFWEDLYITQNEKGDLFPQLEFIQDQFFKMDMEKLQMKKEYLAALKNNSPFTAINEETAIVINILKQNYFRYGGGILPRLLRHSLREV